MTNRDVSDAFTTGGTKPPGTMLLTTNSIFDAIGYSTDTSSAAVKFTNAQTRSWPGALTLTPAALDGVSLTDSAQYPYDVLAIEREAISGSFSYYWNKRPAIEDFYAPIWEMAFGPVGGERASDGGAGVALVFLDPTNGYKGVLQIDRPDGTQIRINDIDLPEGYWLNFEYGYNPIDDVFFLTVTNDSNGTVYCDFNQNVQIQEHSDGVEMGPAYISHRFAGVGSTANSWDFVMFLDDVAIQTVDVEVPVLPPPPPRNLTVISRTHDTLTIGWEPPEGKPNATYTVWLKVDGVEEYGVGSETTETFTGLKADTDYTFAVRTSGEGLGPNGDWVEIVSSTASLRPHYHRSIRDGNGKVRLGATVELLAPGTEDPFGETVYSTSGGSTERGASWVSIDGLVDFYLDAPALVDIQITPAGGEPPKRFVNHWVGDLSDTLVASLG